MDLITSSKKGSTDLHSDFFDTSHLNKWQQYSGKNHNMQQWNHVIHQPSGIYSAIELRTWTEFWPTKPFRSSLGCPTTPWMMRMTSWWWTRPWLLPWMPPKMERTKGKRRKRKRRIRGMQHMWVLAVLWTSVPSRTMTSFLWHGDAGQVAVSSKLPYVGCGPQKTGLEHSWWG